LSTLPAAPASGSRYSIVCLSKFHRHGPGQRREDGLAPYQVVLRYGHEQAAEYLAAHGVDTTATSLDRFLAACGAGDGATAAWLHRAHPDLLTRLSTTDAGLVFLLAEQGRVEALTVLPDRGFPVDFPGSDGETPLHVAAWHGQRAVVEALLVRGAALEVVERQFGCTLLGWAAHGCDS